MRVLMSGNESDGFPGGGAGGAASAGSCGGNVHGHSDPLGEHDSAGPHRPLEKFLSNVVVEVSWLCRSVWSLASGFGS